MERNMTTDATTLASLCTNAVAAYIDACGGYCGPAFDASLDGLLAVEATNWRTWRADGFDWPAVRSGLTAAWAERAGA
jgi:hypothetical protein